MSTDNRIVLHQKLLYVSIIRVSEICVQIQIFLRYSKESGLKAQET